MSEMIETRCCWPDCERLRPVDPAGMRLCWPHMRLAAEEYLAEIAKSDEREDRAKSKKVASDGWVYYIQVGELIKVGHTKALHERIRAYPPDATLLAIEPGTRKLEQERHSRFHAHLKHGREWFADAEEVRSWIDQVRADNAAAWRMHVG